MLPIPVESVVGRESIKPPVHRFVAIPDPQYDTYNQLFGQITVDAIFSFRVLHNMVTVFKPKSERKKYLDVALTTVTILLYASFLVVVSILVCIVIQETSVGIVDSIYVLFTKR